MKSLINAAFLVFVRLATSCSDSRESDLSEAAKAAEQQSTTGGSNEDQDMEMGRGGFVRRPVG